MNIREQVKQLWHDVFDDADNFVNLYFERIYSDEINYTVEYDGRVVAALQAITFDFKLGNEILKTAYLSGIATNRGYRNKGFMRQLLDKTHHSLQSKDFDAVWLIPAEEYLFEIYRKFGYRTLFYKDYSSIDVTDYGLQKNDIFVDILKNNELNKAFDYFLRKQLEQECGVLFSKNFFEVIFDIFALENNQIYIAQSKQNIEGIAFVISQNKVVRIFADSPEIERAIFVHIAKISKQSSITLKTNDKMMPYGMGLFFDKKRQFPDNMLPSVSLMLDE